MPSPPDRLVRLAVGDVSVVVDLEAGARAVEWAVAGHELLGHYGDHPVEHGMYPMAPWAGRIRDNTVQWNGHDHVLPVTRDPWALHGTVLAQPATVLDLTSDPDEARLVARVEEHPGWPWPMAVDVEWLLAAPHIDDVHHRARPRRAVPRRGRLASLVPSPPG